MKTGKHIPVLYAIVSSLVLICAGSCERDMDERGLMTRITVIMELPDGRDCSSVVPLSSSFITNYNTRDSYAFGSFVGNRSVVEVQKGIYILMLDATVYFDDGTVRTVRNADYAQPSKALEWLGDSAELQLKMVYID